MWRTMRRNNATLIGFEIIFKLATTGLMVPLIYAVFELTMRLTGYTYLTAENIGKFLTRPLFFLCPLILFLVLMFYTLFDVSAVMMIIDHAHHERRIDILQVFRLAARNLCETLAPRKFAIAPILALLSMLFGVSVVPSLLNRLTLPDYLLRRISHKWYVILVGVIIVAGLLLVFLRYLYAFHYMSLEGCDFREAMKRSARLSRRKGWKDLIFFVSFQALLYLAYLGFIVLEMLIAVTVGRIFAAPGAFSAFSNSVALIILSVTLIIVTLLGAPIGFSCISLLYYRRKRSRNEAIISLPIEREESENKARMHLVKKNARKRVALKRRHKVIAIEAILLAAALAITCFYIYGRQRNWFNPNIEYVHVTEVTAHRGASWFCPENTMAAFARAAEQGADWIELDVHLSKDFQIFVMHDSNFRRTTGVNAYAWTKTYDEIAQMDAGSWFSEEFRGERIPLLAEVIEFAIANDVRLNIEIKPSPQEEGLEEGLVVLLQEMGFTDRCVVTSQIYSSIARVKELDPSIRTVYVMGFAYGNIDRLEDADDFSVRSISVSESLVRRVHNAGKPVYAWTVNSSRQIDEMIDRQVDNIITDNVPLAKRRIDQANTGGMLSDYLRSLHDLI